MLHYLKEVTDFLHQCRQNVCEILLEPGDTYYYQIQLINKYKVGKMYDRTVPNPYMLLEFIMNQLSDISERTWEEDICIVQYTYRRSSSVLFHPLQVKIKVLTKDEFLRCLKKNQNKYLFLKKQ